MGGSAKSSAAVMPDDAAAANTQTDRIRTAGHWFGPEERPHLGWLARPAGHFPRSGVVVLPPIGYAYWCSHRSLRSLAEQLAHQGHAALRIDYDGTGDSAGDQWDPDRPRMWRRTAAEAVTELRRLGCERMAVVGVRLGATFALLDGASLGAERIVAWAPVISGRRYVKELRLLSTPVPGDADPLGSAGTLVSAGNVFSAQTLAELEHLQLAEIDAAPAPRVLVLDGPSRPAATAVARLRSLGADVDHLQLPGGEQALETPPEFATVPEPIIAAMCRWLGPGDLGKSAPPPTRSAARLAWQGTAIDEEVVTFGEHRHVGILSSPLQTDPAGSTLVLLNPGSETHVGPGRAWVELARSLAVRGHRSIRVDFRGWGESPDADRAPGRPYDACGEGDATVIAQALKGAGHPRVVLFGLCASAWIALRAALHAPVAGVIALNPQMYWRPGDPVEIDWDLIRARRASEIRRITLGSRWRIWSVLDAIGLRPPAAAWLDELAAANVPIELLFAEHDDGIVFLSQRLRRRLARVTQAGSITVRELPQVDHPMHMAWLRPIVVDALDDALRRIDATVA